MHDEPGWVTVAVWPMTDTVAVRAVDVVFGSAVKAMKPVPLPEPPELILSHDAFVLAVQAHPAVVFTVSVPVPPVAGAACVAGARE